MIQLIHLCSSMFSAELYKYIINHPLLISEPQESSYKLFLYVAIDYDTCLYDCHQNTNQPCPTLKMVQCMHFLHLLTVNVLNKYFHVVPKGLCDFAKFRKYLISFLHDTKFRLDC